MGTRVGRALRRGGEEEENGVKLGSGGAGLETHGCVGLGWGLVSGNEGSNALPCPRRVPGA